MSILLTVIFKFFSNLVILENNIKVAKDEIFEKSNLDIKLNKIFSKLKFSHFTESSFYTKENALYFFFDNEIDPDPNFANIIRAKLFLDKKNLILKTAPFDLNIQTRREEILIKNIDILEFNFFKKKEQIIKSSKWEEIGAPDIIKIQLMRKDKHFVFTFFPICVQSSITYFDKKL